MTSQPLVPLRWYEHWMLRFLAKSPRIQSIYVIQQPPELLEPSPPVRPPLPRPEGSLHNQVAYLEALLNLPPQDDTRQG